MTIRLPIALVLATLVVPSFADAQQRARRNWLFGVEVGVIGSQPDEYYTGTWFEPRLECTARTGEYLGIDIGRRVREWLHIDAVVSAQVTPYCERDLVLAPGPFTQGQYLGNTPGGDYFATTLRAVIDPGTATLRPRAVIGLGYIPSKDVPQLALGAGISAGGIRTRFVSEFGFLLPRVKWTRRFTEYGQERAVVREWTENGTTTRRQFYGRVGVEF